MTLSAYIEGIGLLGPGLTGWSGSQAMLTGQRPCQPDKTVLPSPALLPAAERRRSGAIVKLTLAVGLEAINAAGLNAADLACVFSASGGDGENCHAICEMLATDDRQISPTRFHNSVHNTAAGYWSIATGAMSSASVLCAFDASFGAGLLEALSQVVADDARVVMLACDTAYPEPLNSARPINDAFGIALVLSPVQSEQALAKISVSLTDARADLLEDATLESLRASIPAARGLPLLCAVAMRNDACMVLDYLGDTRLSVAITPC
ncbi:MAG: beta-ketoacyl synthase chain length factor [Gallionella sp.]|nr:beta-ketoacyl synthase chain length factor [Gallionella sp.]